MSRDVMVTMGVHETFLSQFGCQSGRLGGLYTVQLLNDKYAKKYLVPHLISCGKCWCSAVVVVAVVVVVVAVIVVTVAVVL